MKSVLTTPPFVDSKNITQDEWANVYTAVENLVNKLSVLTYADRAICLKEWLLLVDTMNSRTNKQSRMI